jgi:hypothetical protein
MGWQSGSNGSATLPAYLALIAHQAYQVRDPEFKPQYYQKKKKK